MENPQVTMAFSKKGSDDLDALELAPWREDTSKSVINANATWLVVGPPL